MKSIYKPDDLRCTPEGLNMLYEASEFFKAMIAKYPDYDPREMIGLFLGEFDSLANRRILELRRSGVLRQE
jgi:hypothetical protein